MSHFTGGNRDFNRWIWKFLDRIFKAIIFLKYGDGILKALIFLKYGNGIIKALIFIKYCDGLFYAHTFLKYLEGILKALSFLKYDDGIFQALIFLPTVQAVFVLLYSVVILFGLSGEVLSLTLRLSRTWYLSKNFLSLCLSCWENNFTQSQHWQNCIKAVQMLSEAIKY